MSEIQLPSRRNFILGLSGILLASQAPAMLTTGTHMKIWVPKPEKIIVDPWEGWDITPYSDYRNGKITYGNRIWKDGKVAITTIGNVPIDHRLAKFRDKFNMQTQPIHTYVSECYFKEYLTDY